jgi:hypothetical protein
MLHRTHLVGSAGRYTSDIDKEIKDRIKGKIAGLKPVSSYGLIPHSLSTLHRRRWSYDMPELA